MEETHFDAWTRRRFGLMAGGALVALAGWQGTDAKKKKKRCKKLGDTCKPGGKRRCCGRLRCDVPGGKGNQHEICCKTAGKPCNPDNPDADSECCGDLFCCFTTATCAPGCVA